MATYQTDFGHNTVGAAPSDWTQLWSLTWNTFAVYSRAWALSGKAFILRSNTTARTRFAAFNDVPANTISAQMFVRGKTGSTTAPADWAPDAALLKGAPLDADLRRGYLFRTENAVSATEVNATSRTSLLNDAGDSTGTNIGTAASPIPVGPDDLLCMLAEVAPGVQRYKVWIDGTAEPAWMIETTDATWDTLEGHFGLVVVRLNRYFEVDFFSVGTAGDPAPRPAANPTITEVIPVEVYELSAPSITGTVFGALQGTGVVKLSPTNSVGDVNAVTQPVETWSDISITLTSMAFPVGTVANDSLYLFVTNDAGQSNTAGYSLTANLLASAVITVGTFINPALGGFQVRFTTDTASGTAYYVVQPVGTADPTAAQIKDGLNGAGAAALATASMVISTTGVQTFPATTGLSANTEYRVAVVHYALPA